MQTLLEFYIFQLLPYFVDNSLLLIIVMILEFFHMFGVIFTNYAICIINNHLFNYSIQNYLDVLVTN